MVGYASTEGACGLGSPIWGISARRALWSLYSVRKVVVVVGRVTSVGMRRTQWSSAELVGVKVGMSVSPKCVRDMYVRRSARRL